VDRAQFRLMVVDNGDNVTGNGLKPFRIATRILCANLGERVLSSAGRGGDWLGGKSSTRVATLWMRLQFFRQGIQRIFGDFDEVFAFHRSTAEISRP
jgi:hypothetical protein